MTVHPMRAVISEFMTRQASDTRVIREFITIHTGRYLIVKHAPNSFTASSQFGHFDR
jgi:hypothetical protein